ncbi:serine protease [Photobacterium rosenbergii]|uniref:Serine protease n=1 Tax=Photobacterium rosenbergii TaxID=294936 RepID=A0A2T3NGH4_9GAMM|nr:serine protease [Photobacterium rosenbergii]
MSSGMLLLGCNDSAEPMVGADEDEHGCKQSAGYSWCAKTEQCERPWELAEQEGFDNTEEAFEGYCSNEKENE